MMAPIPRRVAAREAARGVLRRHRVMHEFADVLARRGETARADQVRAHADEWLKAVSK